MSSSEDELRKLDKLARNTVSALYRVAKEIVEFVDLAERDELDSNEVLSRIQKFRKDNYAAESFPHLEPYRLSLLARQKPFDDWNPATLKEEVTAAAQQEWQEIATEMCDAGITVPLRLRLLIEQYEWFVSNHYEMENLLDNVRRQQK